ncbi:hypothetical protein HDV00_004128, partial [Rhizophlyctis rosea]
MSVLRQPQVRSVRSYEQYQQKQYLSFISPPAFDIKYRNEENNSSYSSRGFYTTASRSYAKGELIYDDEACTVDVFPERVGQYCCLSFDIIQKGIGTKRTLTNSSGVTTVFRICAVCSNKSETITVMTHAAKSGKHIDGDLRAVVAHARLLERAKRWDRDEVLLCRIMLLPFRYNWQSPPTPMKEAMKLWEIAQETGIADGEVFPKLSKWAQMVQILWYQRGSIEKNGERCGWALFPTFPYLNHGCRPNVATRTICGNGRIVTAIYALRKIKKGDELLCNYLNISIPMNESTNNSPGVISHL